MVDKAVTLSDKQQRRHCTPRAMEPVEQIDPNSYIGLAFKCLDKGKKPTNKKRRTRSSLPKTSLDSSYDSSSDLSSNDSDSNDSGGDSLDSSLESSVTSKMSSSTTSSQLSKRGGWRRSH